MQHNIYLGSLDYKKKNVQSILYIEMNQSWYFVHLRLNKRTTSDPPTVTVKGNFITASDCHQDTMARVEVVESTSHAGRPLYGGVPT